LIAKFYKYVGVLSKAGDNFKLNFKYEPRDFTQNSKYTLDFLNEVCLGDENIIMFNEKEISEKLKKLQNQVL